MSRFLDREPVTGRDGSSGNTRREGRAAARARGEPEATAGADKQARAGSASDAAPSLRPGRASVAKGPGVRFARISPETHALSAPAEVVNTQLPPHSPRVWATSSRVFGKCIRAEYPKNDLDCAPVFVNTATSPQHGRIVYIRRHLFSFLRPSVAKFCRFYPCSNSDTRPFSLPANQSSRRNAISFSLMPFL